MKNKHKIFATSRSRKQRSHIDSRVHASDDPVSGGSDKSRQPLSRSRLLWSRRETIRPLPCAILSASALGLIAGATDTNAQSTGKLEEVVVTAQKRGGVENAQDVPIALYGFSGDTIERAQIMDLADLGQLVPAADMPPVAPIRGFANFNIRGMGTIGTVITEDPTVSIVLNGVPLGISAGGVLDIYDLESAEVLAGPQGTLFGRNTTGGAVLLRTRRPSGETGGRLELGAGNFGNFEVSGAVEGATGDGTVAGRLAVRYQENDDIFDNRAGPDVGERELYIVRPSLRFQPNDGLLIDVVAEFGKDEGDGPAARNIFDLRSNVSQQGSIPPSNKFDLSLNNPNSNESEWMHLVAEVNYDLAGGVLTSISGYREFEQINEVDSDSTELSVFNFNPFIDHEQMSQELRWSGSLSDGINLTTGVYLFSQEIDYRERRVIFDGVLTPALQSRQQTDQWAVFGQGTFALSDSLELLAGLRYTEEDKEIVVSSFTCSFDFTSCPVDQNLDDSWSNLGGKLGLNWTLSDDWLVWTSLTRGYRSGGFNGRNPNPQTPAGPFGEETVNAFEIGSKIDFADGRGRLNVAAYYNEFDDLQRTILNADNLQTVENAASANISGVELDFAYSLTDHWRLYSGVAFVDADYDEFQGLDVDFPGDGIADPQRAAQLEFFNVAEWQATGTLALEDLPVTLFGKESLLSLRAGFSWKDEFASNIRNLIIYDDIFIVNASASVRLPGDKTSLTLYGRNLSNEQYGQGAAATGLFFVDFIAPPREWGARVAYEF